MLLFLLNIFLYFPVWLNGKSRTIKIFLQARLPFSASVLDIGSGHNPWFRSTLLCERYLVDNIERAGRLERGKRPLCNADATALPFRDKSVDFVYCSHIAEHIDDIGKFFQEVQRVGKRGYIETPNYLFEQLVGTTTHDWALWVEGDVLHAERKWMAGSPERTYHAAHRLIAKYPLVAYGASRIPELKVMSFWWKDHFDFVLHPAPRPLALTKSSK